MCGRYDMSETPARLGSRYRIDVGQLDFAPNTDVRPTTLNPVILLRDGKREGELMRWGLVPYWANDPKAITNCFNARSESAYQKPMFRGSFKNKRCLVPASAFYEWTHVPGVPRKVKYRISRSDGDLVALAGLWDYWHREDQEILSYTILTTVPNEMMAELHDRMPAILGEEEWDEWLAPESSIDSLRAMCMSCPSEWLTAEQTPS
jgi:putative SOS response-associated peptidase YedK